MSKLLETLLRSEFKFGFELEAYVHEDKLKHYNQSYEFDDWASSRVDDDYENDTIHLDDDEPDEFYINYSELYSDLEKEFSQYFGEDIDVYEDSSLSEGGFEFPTPPMNLTPLNIKKCIDFLDSLDKSQFKIYTNSSCGFHVHFSFPSISKEDMAWILCHVALDSKLQNELMFFTTSFGNEFDFFNHYASTDFLQDIESAIKTHDWEELSVWLNNEKYRVLRLHPQGTIEWRGPRDFLETKNKQIIKEFFIKFSNSLNNVFCNFCSKKINKPSNV